MVPGRDGAVGMRPQNCTPTPRLPDPSAFPRKLSIQAATDSGINTKQGPGLRGKLQGRGGAEKTCQGPEWGGAGPQTTGADSWPPLGTGRCERTSPVAFYSQRDELAR